MANYCVFMGEDKIKLPNNLNTQERIELCQKIIDEHPEYFEYIPPTGKYTKMHSSDKVKMRLATMGEYIYTSSTRGKDSSVITDWKKYRNKKNEIQLY